MMELRRTRDTHYDASMTKILIVNPNTTASMTETIGAAARAVAAPGTENIGRDVVDGPGLDRGILRRGLRRARPDPGAVEARRMPMRRSSPVSMTPGSTPHAPAARFPVVGICEAALVTAGQIAKRIAVVTTLPRSIVPLEELVRRYGFAERAQVTACNVAVLDLEKPGSGAEEKLEAEIARALDKGAEAIVLGCAGHGRSRAEAVAESSACLSSMAWRPR